MIHPTGRLLPSLWRTESRRPHGQGAGQTWQRRGAGLQDKVGPGSETGRARTHPVCGSEALPGAGLTLPSEAGGGQRPRPHRLPKRVLSEPEHRARGGCGTAVSHSYLQNFYLQVRKLPRNHRGHGRARPVSFPKTHTPTVETQAKPNPRAAFCLLQKVGTQGTSAGEGDLYAKDGGDGGHRALSSSTGKLRAQHTRTRGPFPDAVLAEEYLHMCGGEDHPCTPTRRRAFPEPFEAGPAMRCVLRGPPGARHLPLGGAPAGQEAHPAHCPRQRLHRQKRFTQNLLEHRA